MPSAPATRGSGYFLPPRPFLYTTDQVAMLLGLNDQYVRRRLIWYNGRSVGARTAKRMTANDISGDDSKKPEWRISEGELLAWMRRQGFHIYERSWMTDRIQPERPTKLIPMVEGDDE